MKKVLLVSSPRSGSTLIANIIRSNSSVAFFNEIFTRAPQLIPNFEKAYQLSSPNLKEVFERDFARLEKYKLGYCGNILHRHRLMKFVIFLFLKSVASIESKLFDQGNKWSLFHKIYHVNSLHEPPIKPFWLTQFTKYSQSEILFIKDVRMRKAYFSFKQMYPDAYFIYLIRNPYKVIASTLRQRQLTRPEDTLIDRGHLEEAFLRPELVKQFHNKSVEHNFALQWLLENELVYSDINRGEHKTKIIVFDKFIKDIPKNAYELFQFIDCNYSEETISFIKALTSYDRPQKHGRSTFVSPSGSRENRKGLTAEQFKHVAEIVNRSSLLSFWSH